MLILKTLELLGTRSATLKEINEISRLAKNKDRFDELVKERINPSVYNWAERGVAKTHEELLSEFARTYCKSQIDAIVADKFKISHSAASSNLVAFDHLIRDIANDSVLLVVEYGSVVEEVVKNTTHTILNNRGSKIKDYYIPKTKPGDFEEEVLIENAAMKINKVTDPMVALSRFDPVEVKLILTDIHQTHGKFTYSPQGMPQVIYSIYESYLRASFKRKFKESNSKGRVSIELQEHGESRKKLNKLDELIDQLYDTYIITGITNNNLPEFLQQFYNVAVKIATNNTLDFFGLQDTKEHALGNFNTQKTFTSEGKRIFDILTKGIIALSKLHKMLVICNVEPYRIHPSIFSERIEDPSTKFDSLDEVVRYSSLVVNAREKYGYDTKYGNLRTVRSDKGDSSKVNLNRLISARNEEVVTTMSSGDKTSGRVWYDQAVVKRLASREGYFVKYLTVGLASISLFDVIKCIDRNQNPLQAIFELRTDVITIYPDVDLDEVMDIPASRLPYYSKFTQNAEKYLENEMSPELLQELIKDATPEVSSILNEVVNGKGKRFVPIFRAARAFGEKYLNAREEFETRYLNSEVTSVEGSYFVFNSDMFAGLDKVVTVADINENNRSRSLVLDVMTHMLGRIDSTITKDYVLEFAETFSNSPATAKENHSVDATLLSAAISIINLDFTKLTKVYTNALSHIANLSKSGKRNIVIGDYLQDKLTQLDGSGINPRFTKFAEGFTKTKDGYLVDSMGAYKSVMVNNKSGFLHSTGYYIFDGEKSIKWGDI